MGKKKLTIIDDSQPEVEIKDQKIKNKKKVNPNKETNVGAAGGSEESSLGTTAVSEANEEVPRDTELTGPASDQSEATKADEPEVKPKKAQKPGKQKKVRSKKYLESLKDLDKTKSYPITEAVDLVKKLSYSKFEGTFEAHINTIQTGLRGLVSLPFASGKKLTILAFGKNAESSGADIIGTDETIETIGKGKLGFDLVVTSPDWMSKLAKVARILGPRGLMPNPKNGTITEDLKKAVEGFQAGKTEYKTEPKAAVIHLGLGKLSQPTEELKANVQTLIQTLGKTRVKKISLSSTMGPSVKVDLSSL